MMWYLRRRLRLGFLLGSVLRLLNLDVVLKAQIGALHVITLLPRTIPSSIMLFYRSALRIAAMVSSMLMVTKLPIYKVSCNSHVGTLSVPVSV